MGEENGEGKGKRNRKGARMALGGILRVTEYSM